jgi:1-phosphofructokinase
MITLLGQPVTVCAAIGGEVGTVLRPLIAGEGVKLRVVARQSISGWYVHDRRGGRRHRHHRHHRYRLRCYT